MSQVVYQSRAVYKLKKGMKLSRASSAGDIIKTYCRLTLVYERLKNVMLVD